MKELSEYEEREIYKNFEKLERDMKLYAVMRLLPPNLVLRLAYNESNYDLFSAIEEKLKIEKECDFLMNKYRDLAKVDLDYWAPIYLVVEIAPIEVVVDIALQENQEVINDAILKRFEKDSEDIKQYYLKLIESKNSEIRKFVAKNASMEIVVEMALIEENNDVMNTLLRRLEEQIDTELLKQNYSKFSKLKSWQIRLLVSNYVPMETVIEMALTEENDGVICTLLERLEEQIDTELLKQSYSKLSKAKAREIRKFVAENAPIETVVEMVLIEKDTDVIKTLLEILEEQIDTDILKQSYSKLSKAESWRIREFVASYVPIEMVIEMALTEVDIYLTHELIKILEKEIDNDLVKQSYSKLSKAKSYKIRKIVAENAPIELIVEMALIEKDTDVIKRLSERLEEQIDTDLLKQSYSKLSKAKSDGIREFVAKNAPIETVIEMSLIEVDSDVIYTLSERLEEQIDTELLKQSYSKLSKANAREIRKFVAENAPIELIIEIVLIEENLAKFYDKKINYLYQWEDSIINILCQRLVDNVDKEIVKQNYTRLAKAKSYQIRMFVAEHASMEIVVEMALIEEYLDVLHKLYHRIQSECEDEVVKQNYAELAKVDFTPIKIFVMKHAPVEIIEEVLSTEEDKKRLDAIKKFLFE